MNAPAKHMLPRPAQGDARIVVPGRNAWRSAPARRVAMLVDAAEYFARLEQALLKARRSIFIIGWDFNGRISLTPDRKGAPSLGSLLRGLVETRPELEVRLLIWSLGPIFSELAMRFLPDEQWADHPRIHLRYDGKLPLRGSQHQKLVCIDDDLAFVGGIDLTTHRWDTPEHAARHPRRADLKGRPYAPFHDVQMAVQGDAARAMAEHARRRWREVTGEACQGLSRPNDCWPEGLAPDFEDVEVAIARTCPPGQGRRAIREIERLNHDALRSAKRHIYIEAQYLAARRIGRLLEEQLRKPDGPEVVIVVTRDCPRFLERFLMCGNRDRLLRRLLRADVFGRLRVMHPVVPAGGDAHDREVFVHAKVIIVDDAFFRAGSSNLNNRSMGLDRECDIAIEAQSTAERERIARLRERLLAEHLACSPEALRQAMKEETSLIGAIERLNTGARGLRPIELSVRRGPTEQMLLTPLFDPEQPAGFAALAAKAAGALRRRVAARASGLLRGIAVRG
jgi:phospholipase D1/2